MDFPPVVHIRARDNLSSNALSRAPLPSQSSTFASSSSSGSRGGIGSSRLPTSFASKAQDDEAAERERRAEKARLDAEWLIDPKNHGHGPRPEIRIPVFLPTQGTYDELGRVIESVDDAGKGKGKATDEGGVADWFKSLPASRASSLPASRASSPPPTPKPTPIATPPNGPLVIPPSQWFIRRVLLSQHDPYQTKPKAKPSSIGSLIDSYDAEVEKPKNFGYVLGPRNKGYELLKKSGWEGGGLGARPPAPPPQVIDLTLSDSDEEEEDEEEIQIVDVKPSIFDAPPTIQTPPAAVPTYGPGRTAPIATALKSDRLGIGHSIAKKRITHTSRELRQHGKKAKWIAHKKPEKPKDRERRERAETQRIAASLL